MRDYWILGSKVTGLSTDELLSEIDATVSSNQKEVILNTNVHGIDLARRIGWLRDFRNRVRITHCDGFGVALGARILGYDIGQRVCINDFIWPLARRCATRGHSLYLLGARPETITSAATVLREHEPDLSLAGFHHGYFAKEGYESNTVVDQINDAQPNILLVGFGMPVQEQWVRDNIHRIQTNVVMVVGGFFDRLSGTVPFAPRWVTENGLEWLYLSLKRPSRFFSRYMVTNPRFLSQVLLQRAGLAHYPDGADYLEAQGYPERATGH